EIAAMKATVAESEDRARRVKKLEKKLKKRDQEIAQLRMASVASAQSEVDAMVDAVCLMRGVGGAQRAHLVTLATADRAAFLATSPGANVRAQQRYLMTNVASGRHDGAPTPPPDPNASVKVPGIGELVTKFTKEGLGFEEAHSRAFEELQACIAK